MESFIIPIVLIITIGVCHCVSEICDFFKDKNKK